MRVVAEMFVRVGKRLEGNLKGLYAKADNRDKLDISATKKIVLVVKKDLMDNNQILGNILA